MRRVRNKRQRFFTKASETQLAIEHRRYQQERYTRRIVLPIRGRTDLKQIAQAARNGWDIPADRKRAVAAELRRLAAKDDHTEKAFAEKVGETLAIVEAAGWDG